MEARRSERPAQETFDNPLTVAVPESDRCIIESDACPAAELPSRRAPRVSCELSSMYGEANSMLYEFITLNRDEIITRCRAKVATRSMPPPSEAEINHGVPLFLDQLVEMLQSGGTTFEIDKSAGQHGHDLLLQGFTVSQVVHDYGDVCQTVTDLALETNAPISTEDFRTLNRCLDEAIASAVTMYTRESQKSHSAEAADRDNERVEFLVHELRNLVNTSVVAFEVLKSGNVGVGGSTGAVLNRSLTGLRDLIARSIEEVRSSKAVKSRKRILVSDLIEEIGTASTLEADARHLRLVVSPVQEELAIEADKQILSAVVGNLVQNAFKFTRSHSTVTLRVRASADRVLIDVQDECGGLPGELEDEDLVPAFEQRGADRTGLGIGLAFSRWGAEANGGRLYARNLPGTGCVFTLDLPRSSVPAAASP
jgi:signal transduction histidine kinase